MVSFERARLYTMFKGVNGGQGKSKPFGGLKVQKVRAVSNPSFFLFCCVFGIVLVLLSQHPKNFRNQHTQCLIMYSTLPLLFLILIVVDTYASENTTICDFKRENEVVFLACPKMEVPDN